MTAANSTNSTTGTFYIVTSDDAFEPSGFATSNTTVPDGAVTDGFIIYGSQVMYNSGTTYEAQFWAVPQNGTDEAQIYWNEDGASQDGAVPVSLKTTSPTA